MDSFEEMDSRIKALDIPMKHLISYFRTKCKSCGHHRIMHDDAGVCGGVMNKPCNSGCDCFNPE